MASVESPEVAGQSRRQVLTLGLVWAAQPETCRGGATAPLRGGTPMSQSPKSRPAPSRRQAARRCRCDRLDSGPRWLSKLRRSVAVGLRRNAGARHTRRRLMCAASKVPAELKGPFFALTGAVGSRSLARPHRDCDSHSQRIAFFQGQSEGLEPLVSARVGRIAAIASIDVSHLDAQQFSELNLEPKASPAARCHAR